MLLYALIALQSVSVQTDRLAEIGEYAALSGVCADLGYTLSEDFAERLHLRIGAEAETRGIGPAELDELLAPHLTAFIEENTSELEAALARIAQNGDSAALSSLFVQRDKACHKMMKDPISADLIAAGSPEAREAARRTRVDTIVEQITQGE